MCLARLLFKSLILDDYDSASHSALLLCLNLVLKVLFCLELGITQVQTISKRSVLALLIHATSSESDFWPPAFLTCFASRKPLDVLHWLNSNLVSIPRCGTCTNRSFGKDGPLWSGLGSSTEDWPQADPPGLLGQALA